MSSSQRRQEGTHCRDRCAGLGVAGWRGAWPLRGVGVALGHWAGVLGGEDAAGEQQQSRYTEELRCAFPVSSSSLVSTNEHLLQELHQARAQHKAEVEQLHWSYKELKKTMALFPNGSISLGGC